MVILQPSHKTEARASALFNTKSIVGSRKFSHFGKLKRVNAALLEQSCADEILKEFFAEDQSVFRLCTH